MRDIPVGLTHEVKFTVPKSKMVPALYPEIPDFLLMPEVFATGFMVGLLEYTCMDSMKPYLDWPSEQSLGVHVNFSHLAATPEGFEVTVKCRVTAVEGKKVTFEVEAHDGVDLISTGVHQRFVISTDKFLQRLEAKRSQRP